MYRSIKKLTLEEYLEETVELSKKRKLSFRKRAWRFLIKNNILTCPASNKVVSYCSYDANETGKITTYHYNFYTKDGVLFTIDHKKPLAKGGKNTMDNVQPMIGDINWRKGSKEIYM
jgi:hypothetical protein